MTLPRFDSWSNVNLIEYQDVLLVMKGKQVLAPSAWQHQWINDRITAIDLVLDSRAKQLFDVVTEELAKVPDTETGLESAIQAAMKRHPAGSKLPQKGTP